MIKLNRYVTFGRSGDEETPVILTDTDSGYTKEIVNAQGEFTDFPGIEQHSWCRCLPSDFDYTSKKICYRTDFEVCDDGFRCYWEIQPDGMYYADEDRFGAEDSTKVTLAATLDKAGRFTGPFTAYAIDSKRWEPVSPAEQEARIQEMEQRLDISEELLQDFAASWKKLMEYYPEMEKLKDYYYSEGWHQDRYADDANAFPSDLKRGILSEDAIYNFLCDRFNLMTEIKNDITKKFHIS